MGAELAGVICVGFFIWSWVILEKQDKRFNKLYRMITIEEYHNQILNYIKNIDSAIRIATKEKEPFVTQRFEGKVPEELNLHYKNCGYNTELHYDEFTNKSVLKVII